MLSRNKLIDWLLSHYDEEESPPEVVRLVKNLLIELEFGVFDYEDDEEHHDNAYECS
ncbi:hypothetical protein ACFYU8_18725 [Brevibacillus sp. NPDC003359]|uniref:hypothetical protein n=1 Tax=unclassified Brevibacillus TaxID=2684853 RepID=UPI0036AB6076